MSGTYTILVDPQSTALGSATLTLYDVPPDVLGTIPRAAPRSPSASALCRARTQGSRSRATPDNASASGRAGSRSAARPAARRGSRSRSPMARRSVTPTLGTGGGFIDTQLLPAGGTYTILLDPQGTDLGSATLTLYDVPPDLGGTIAIGGPPVTLTLGPVPGQNAKLTFSGPAGQRISLRLSGVTIMAPVARRGFRSRSPTGRPWSHPP